MIIVFTEWSDGWYSGVTTKEQYDASPEEFKSEHKICFQFEFKESDNSIKDWNVLAEMGAIYSDNKALIGNDLSILNKIFTLRQ